MILLTGRWNCAGNLLIETSTSLPDEMPDREVDTKADELISDEYNGWAASFLVDDHKQALQEAYEVYVKNEDGRLIDHVEGVVLDD
ncbi:hypothetical protein [Streptomyces werraensis]|uniref:hypothetical protein n=1 Tax=Streptomyces werraensis TaxID=68284 RepID=UPI0034145557